MDVRIVYHNASYMRRADRNAATNDYLSNRLADLQSRPLKTVTGLCRENFIEPIDAMIKQLKKFGGSEKKSTQKKTLTTGLCMYHIEVEEGK